MMVTKNNFLRKIYTNNNVEISFLASFDSTLYMIFKEKMRLILGNLDYIIYNATLYG